MARCRGEKGEAAAGQDGPGRAGRHGGRGDRPRERRRLQRLSLRVREADQLGQPDRRCARLHPGARGDPAAVLAGALPAVPAHGVARGFARVAAALAAALATAIAAAGPADLALVPAAAGPEAGAAAADGRGHLPARRGRPAAPGPHRRARLQPGQRQTPLPVDRRRGQAAGARAAVRLALLRAAARRADGALPDGHPPEGARGRQGQRLLQEGWRPRLRAAEVRGPTWPGELLAVDHRRSRRPPAGGAWPDRARLRISEHVRPAKRTGAVGVLRGGG
mmetsp:Transcript_79712/g.172295  ORF Transcript_79712/g.172295 Transcript_79712/m.172295 type:complete len:278 (-) Transcript_79712:291-1124(-)